MVSSWLGIGPADLKQNQTGAATLRVENVWGRPVVGKVWLDIVAGDVTKHTPLAEIDLAVDAVSELAIDLGALDVPVKGLKFSGHFASRTTVKAEDLPSPRSVGSPTVYFHGDDDSVFLYGEKVLHEQFGSGDLKGALNELDIPKDSSVNVIDASAFGPPEVLP